MSSILRGENESGSERLGSSNIALRPQDTIFDDPNLSEPDSFSQGKSSEKCHRGFKEVRVVKYHALGFTRQVVNLRRNVIGGSKRSGNSVPFLEQTRRGLSKPPMTFLGKSTT